MITALCLALTAMMGFTPAPADHVPVEMMLIEIAQDGDLNRSSGDGYHGQCKRFQYDTFMEIADGYVLPDYPDASLFMPLAHADEEESGGRPVGTGWTMPDASEGNAFVEVARFDYDKTMTRDENIAAVVAFLRNVRAGDVMQMVARYSSGGRGTHTLMFSRPYDERLDTLYWIDSNFSNTRIDGVRHGYVRATQAWKIAEVADWLTKDWHNGATLYRVNPDIALAAE